MGFQVINEEHSVVKFVFDKDFSKDDFKKFLGILSRLLDIAEDTNKPFGFYVDARKAYVAPYNCARNLIAWMVQNKPRIKERKMLRVSAVCIKSKVLTSMINGAFRIQPTVSPNIITVDIEKAKKFVTDIMLS